MHIAYSLLGSIIFKSLQLCHHHGRVPVAPYGLDFSFLIDLEHIDTLKENWSTVFAGAAPREFNGDPVPGLEHMVSRQADCLKRSEHSHQELP